MSRPTPNWQPLSMLPTFAEMVSAQLDEVETQRQTLREAQKQPHVLDDYTVGRVLKVYGEQQEVYVGIRSAVRALAKRILEQNAATAD